MVLSKKKKLKCEKRGFTLLETLMAIVILLVALTSIIGLAAQSLHNVPSLKQQTIATNLAHEGVELLRNIRDNNVHQEVAWDSGFCSVAGYPCDREIACNNANCPNSIQLQQDMGRFLRLSGTGFYNYSGGPNTIYQRRIHLEQLSAVEVRYTVTINWAGKTFSVVGTLNDWRPL